LARFETEVSQHGHGVQPKEDRRRIAVWTAALGRDREARSVDRAVLDAYVRDRRAGRIQVAGHRLATHPSERTIGSDLEFLRRVFKLGHDGCGVGTAGPCSNSHALQRYPIPSNPLAAAPGRRREPVRGPYGGWRTRWIRSSSSARSWIF